MPSQDRSGPFWVFNSQIDPEAIVRAHEFHERAPVEGRLVNYLGVVIDPAFLPDVLKGAAGQVETVPIPANWHADLSEWGAALRAVDLAREKFRVVELGCGWGCWLLNTGTAARRRGLQVELIGVEADEGHVGFARQGCAENGFTPSETDIRRGIVAARKGTALFPRQSVAGMSWGLSPIFGAGWAQTRKAKASGSHDVLPCMTLDEIAGKERPIDLLHIDIQGGEVDFVDTCVGSMNRNVAYTVIGTHSREIEGRLFATMLAHDWILEIERPALLSVQSGKLSLWVDGVQGWRNPRLT